MTLFIGPKDIARLHDEGHVSMRDYVDADERAFREQGERSIALLPRQILWQDEKPAGVRSPAFKMSASLMRGSRVMGASLYPANYRLGHAEMWITLFSGSTGKMLAILHGKALSLWKTGATTAVATRHMAREDADVAALIGTGNYGLTQLLGLAAVRPLRELRCYSRSRERVERFIAAAQPHVPGVKLVAAPDPEAAVRGAGIVTTITTAKEPLVFGRWLDTGVHCNIMGAHDPATREVDSEAVALSRVIVDSEEQAMNEKGEFLIPLEEGRFGREHLIGDLGSVVCGRIAGRRDAAERTMFLSGGTALEYMGTCSLLYERALAARIGQRLDASELDDVVGQLKE